MDEAQLISFEQKTTLLLSLYKCILFLGKKLPDTSKARSKNKT